MWNEKAVNQEVNCDADKHVFKAKATKGERCKCGLKILIKKNGLLRPVDYYLYKRKEHFNGS